MASDFYRLRLILLDEGDAPDLDWRDDILYRDPPGETAGESSRWVVQAVDLEHDDNVIELSSFADHSEARESLDQTEIALSELTRAEFEMRYFGSHQ